MRWITKQIALWTLGTVLISVLCINFVYAETPAPVGAFLAPSVPETVNFWPWMAMGGVLLLLSAIAYGARRRLPFGGR